MNNPADMSTAFWVAGIAQTIMLTAVGIIFLAILLKQKNNTFYRLMLLIAFCALIQNAGYLQEIRATTAGEAMAGIRIEYIGGAFAATLLLALVLLYCGYELPKKCITALVAIDIAVLTSVWTCEINPAYYTGYQFDPDAAIPHILLDKGWLYYVNALLIFGQLCLTIGITIHCMRRTTDIKQHKNYQLLLLSALLPLFSYVLGLSSVLGGFDPAPMGVGLGIIVISIDILVHHAFDLVATAHENIIRELDEAILIVDKNYSFVEANRVAKDLFTGLVDYKKKTGEEKQELAYLFEQKQDAELDLDGRIYRVHKNEIFSEKSLTGYVFILFDITDERRQLEHMQKLKEEADRANAAKSSFLAHVSHEVRTPINAVLGMDEMILRESSDSETLRYARDIKTAAKTLLSIINDILDSSKLESGKMEIVPVSYEQNTLFTDVYHMIVLKANDKQLDLHFEIDSQLPSVLMGDDIRIRQVLLNLLTNAVKYTSKGCVTLRVSAVQEQTGNQVTLRYEVIDTGTGIREEDLPQLYSAFSRIDLERNREVEGTGLGMTIVVQLLKLMGSELHVESTYGQGSNFSFELIQQVVDENPIGEFRPGQDEMDAQEGYAVSFIAPSSKVLVVDDNQTNRVVFQGLLRQTQVQISEADSGMACLEAVQKEHFDVIFMDDMMPGMTGRDTLSRMRELKHNLCADTPVIMLTANAMHGEKEKYLALGFRDFLVKPIDPEQLEAMLGRLLPAAYVRWSVAELDYKEDTAASEQTMESELELLSQVNGLNVSQARLYLPDDELIVETARSFCEMIPGEIETLGQLIDCISDENYLADYRLRVHTIKSTAATIGITDLSGAASLSETAARAQKTERVQALHPMLMELLEIYYNRLHVLVEAQEMEQSLKEPARMEEVLPLLDLLCGSLRERDFDAADILISKLEDYSYPQGLQEKMHQLQTQVMNLEADAACATAEQILQHGGL